MKQNFKKLLSLACVGFLLTGCGFSGASSEKAPDTSKPLAEEGAADAGQYQFPQEDVISDQFGNEMNLFAFDLYDQLATDSDNLFFSPYSIFSALCVLENAAGNDTKAELDSLLRLDDTEKRNSDMKLFAESFTDAGAVLNTANSLWISIDLSVKDNSEESFFAPVKYYYDTDLFQADFNDSQTLTGINNWISEKTEGMIPGMLSAIDPQTAMCIVNAVYFRGTWSTEFAKEETYTQSFRTTGEETEVDMMHQYGKDFAYAKTNDMMGIRLPYGEGGIAMDIWMCSDSSENINDVFSSLSSEEKCALFSTLDDAPSTEITELALPKFTVEGETISLNDALKALGMEESFKDTADFDKINDTLYVSDVYHQAKIEVDEGGTTAAAGSSVGITQMSLDPLGQEIRFIVDRPFIYSIRDCNTGAILFLGVMNQM